MLIFRRNFFSAGKLLKRVLLFTCCCLLQACIGSNIDNQKSVDYLQQNKPSSEIIFIKPQYSWEKPQEQVPVKEGYLEVEGAKLWYWDTGGDGEVVVFSHPASGSGLTWEYQQPFLAKAGYRVIGYSRRGFYQSEVIDPKVKVSASDDLLKLVDHLGIEKFHIIAIAAGGNVAPDLADAHPNRILSLMMGCTIGRTTDVSYLAGNATLRPREFNSLPVYLKELSPFYRGANPAGSEEWIKISAKARGKNRVGANIREMTPEILQSIKHPTLLFTGDADLYMPTSRLRAYAKYWDNPEVVIFRGAGHAPYWEQPLAFNKVMLDFLRRSGQ
jgi:pimeloyl-ACP methyl ester carboxylesterase